MLCRGAIEVERLEWTPEKVDVTLRSETKQAVNLKLGNLVKTVALPAGVSVDYTLNR